MRGFDRRRLLTGGAALAAFAALPGGALAGPEANQAIGYAKSADAALQALLQPATFGTLGDSLTASHEMSSFTTFTSGGGAQSNIRYSNSLLAALDAQLGGGYVQAYANAAVSGTGWDETYTTQVRNFLGVTPRPRFCFMVSPGTNNFFGNSSPRTAAYCEPLALKVFDALIAAGVTPIVLTVPPRDPTTSNTNFPTQTWSSAKDTERLTFNAWLVAQQAARWPDMILIDLAADMQAVGDPTSARTGTTDDGLHLSPTYAWDFTKRILLPRLAPYLKARKYGVFGESDQDTLLNWSGSKQLLDYPTFQNTSGGSVSASAPDSISGTVAGGYTLTATHGSGGATSVVASVVDAQSVITPALARSLGIRPPVGYAQKLVVTSTALGDQVQLSAAPTSSRLTPGDTYFGGALLYLQGVTKLGKASLSSQVVWSSPSAGSISANAGDAHNSTNYVDLDPIFTAGGVLIPLITPPATTPADITVGSLAWRLFLRFDGPGGCIAHIMEPSMKKGGGPFP